MYRHELARTLLGLGTLLENQADGKPEAEETLRQALGLYERLAAESPDVPSSARSWPSPCSTWPMGSWPSAIGARPSPSTIGPSICSKYSSQAVDRSIRSRGR